MTPPHKTLKAVQQYLDCGLVPFPVRPGEKLPVLRYYHAFTNEPPEIQRRATLAAFVALLKKNPAHGVGLYMGSQYPINNHCPIALDFDTSGAYEKWTAANPEMSKIIPTAKTHKGYHALFLNNYEMLSGKGKEVSVISTGWYIVVNPTIHPVSNTPYEWIIPPWPKLPQLNMELLTDGIDWDDIDFECDDYCYSCGEPQCICEDNYFISGAE